MYKFLDQVSITISINKIGLNRPQKKKRNKTTQFDKAIRGFP